MPRSIHLTAVAAATLGALALVPGAASAATPQCTTADISAKVGAVDAGAGQRHAPLVLTNQSGHTCQTAGYVGLQLATSSGKKLPTSTSRSGGKAATVTLKPGQQAVTTLGWTVVATGTEPTNGPCEGTPSDLLVIPPNQRTQTAAPWKNGPVCGFGKFTVTPLKAKG
jgi:hypothetical protein